MEIHEQIISELHALANPIAAQNATRFFKTNIGEYSFGDTFIGVTSPQIRILAKKYMRIDLPSIQKILHSKIHEERLLALVILTDIFTKFKKKREEVIEFYLHEDNIQYINNWDLVDVSAYKTLGVFLVENPHKMNIINTLAISGDIWKKRIAIVSTLALIKSGKFDETFTITQKFLTENSLHDLLQKATGWMLREVGKKNRNALINFLQENHKSMPRIMLSYAMEKLTHDQKSTIKNT